MGLARLSLFRRPSRYFLGAPNKTSAGLVVLFGAPVGIPNFFGTEFLMARNGILLLDNGHGFCFVEAKLYLRRIDLIMNACKNGKRINPPVAEGNSNHLECGLSNVKTRKSAHRVQTEGGNRSSMGDKGGMQLKYSTRHLTSRAEGVA
ncbi:hypothetical protein J6590_017754 [Homalodisca vitripennis]|nr:hypothetical protein J6590_017754 [Homalodisca vitripennis]